MMDATRFYKLYESLDIDNGAATPDPEHEGMYRYIYFFADKDKPIFLEMFNMVGDESHVFDVHEMKTRMAVTKIDGAIITAFEESDLGFCLYMDAHDNLLGEAVTLFDVTRKYNGAKE